MRVQTVEKPVPVYVPLPAEWTAEIPQCEVPRGTLRNADLADTIVKCQFAVDRANWQLDKIRAAQPEPKP